MRIVSILCALVLLGSVARADDDKVDRGLIGTGAALIAVGAVSMLAGGVLAATAGKRGSEITCSGGCSDDSTVGVGAGITLLSVGAIHAASGIPVLAVGATRRARRNAMTLSAAMSPTQGGMSASLAVRW